MVKLDFFKSWFVFFPNLFFWTYIIKLSTRSLFGAWSFLLVHIWFTPSEGPKGLVNWIFWEIGSWKLDHKVGRSKRPSSMVRLHGARGKPIVNNPKTLLHPCMLPFAFPWLPMYSVTHYSRRFHVACSRSMLHPNLRIVTLCNATPSFISPNLRGTYVLSLNLPSCHISLSHIMGFDMKIIRQRIQTTRSHASYCDHYHHCNVDFVLFYNVTSYTNSLLSWPP